MKKWILTILLCLIAMPCFAEKWYVYIDKIGYAPKELEACNNEYGDVIAITEFRKQCKPTRGELGRYKVIVSEMTRAERAELLEVGYDEKKDIYYKARKRKIDIDQLSSIKQEEEVAKTSIFNKVIVKPNPHAILR